MKILLYISSLLLLVSACRFYEKDDELRPRPSFGFTTGTSTGYTESIGVNQKIIFGLQASHFEDMDALDVTDSTGATVFHVNIGSTAFSWKDSVDVGSVTGLKRYNFTITAGNKSNTRTVFADIQ